MALASSQIVDSRNLALATRADPAPGSERGTRAYNRAVALKLFRALVVLMLIVVPVQGVASVASGVCMAFGHHDAAAADDHASHSHEDEHAADAADDSKANHCGPCIACCASASIAGPVSYSIAASSSEAPYILSQLPPTPVEAGGVYRPPLAL